MRSRSTLIRARATLLCAAVLVLATGSVSTAQVSNAEGSREPTSATPPGRFDGGEVSAAAYGTDSFTTVPLHAFAFQPYSSSSGSFAPGSEGTTRHCTDGACRGITPLDTPTGTAILAVELEACDDDASAGITVDLVQHDPLDGATTSLASITTGISAVPGCDYFTAFLDPAPVADQLFNTYVVDVRVDGTTTDVRFQAARVYTTRVVSPAPSTATFDDVATSHLFHQFVEAMAASGVTAGCDADSFCPDAPLTRGQMAVFLAKALGLHWPG